MTKSTAGTEVPGPPCAQPDRSGPKAQPHRKPTPPVVAAKNNCSDHQQRRPVPSTGLPFSFSCQILFALRHRRKKNNASCHPRLSFNSQLYRKPRPANHRITCYLLAVVFFIFQSHISGRLIFIALKYERNCPA